jgi:arginase family enzyme
MINNYIESVDFNFVSDGRPFEKFDIGANIHFYEEEIFDFSEYEVAIIGVKEGRLAGMGNITSDLAPEEIRKQLYRLQIFQNFPKVIDLGNIIDAETPEETYQYLDNVLRVLYQHGPQVIILGGSQDLTIPQVKALEALYENVSLTIVDERIDLKERSKEINSNNYIKELIECESPSLFNLTIFGYQSFFANPSLTSSLESMFFQMLRLGKIRYKVPEYEHIFRSSHAVSIDISCVKQSDAPGRNLQSPNGFMSDELCQIARYAGMSPENKSIGFYELNPQFDIRNQSVQLFAQAIWYFLEGFSYKIEDTPEHEENHGRYINFLVTIDGLDKPLIFWKHKDNGYWWVEIQNNKTGNFFPCGKDDFDLCSNGILSDFIFQIISRL